MNFVIKFALSIIKFSLLMKLNIDGFCETGNYAKLKILQYYIIKTTKR